MKVFDFNVHLPILSGNDVEAVIDNDRHLDEENLIRGFQHHLPVLKNLTGINFLLFNTNLFAQSIQKFREITESHFNHISFTALIDFRRNDLQDYLRRVKEEQVRAVMVNSYLQQITSEDYKKVRELCTFARKHKLIICIDGSYGTSGMYRYDNLKLACHIADNIPDTPIVIIHAGGLRVKEAMLLALDKPNVFLDTSFSLPYYIGSSIEQDFAFACKKMDSDRIFFGSDTPYENSGDALNIHLDFFKKYRFSDSAIERILFTNAQKLLF